MKDSTEIRLIFAFNINDIEQFSQLVKACSAYVAANEPGTLSYDWYIDKDRTSGKLYEVYENAAAFERHVTGPVFTEIVPQYIHSMSWSNIEAFGDMPDIFFAMTKDLAAVTWGEPVVF